MERALSKSASWMILIGEQARQRPWSSLALAIATLALLLMLVPGAGRVLIGDVGPGLWLAVLGGLAGFAGTALGALPALVLRDLPQRFEDSLLGLAAGMMLAASAFSLLLPGLEAAGEITGSRGFGAGVVVLGMLLGVLLMLGLDAFTPHEHESVGPCGPGHQHFQWST